MRELQLLEEHPVAAGHGGRLQEIALAALEREGGADIAALAKEEEFVDRVPVIDEGDRLHAAADAAQFRSIHFERVFAIRVEPEGVKGDQGQLAPKRPDRVTQGSPIAAGEFEQAYFVFADEDESAVVICSDTALAAFSPS
ncbi:MAG: hypothetical protein WDM96_01185 [Lacunisphaera sp.]